MTNLTHALETALLMLAAYLVGCVIGYATRRVLYAGRGTRTVTLAATPAPSATQAPVLRPRREMSPAARLAGSVSAEPLARPAPRSPDRSATTTLLPISQARIIDAKPSLLSRPRAGGADDLKQIKGIGPKIEAALNDFGVYHLDQIADWSEANVDWLDTHFSFKGRIGRENWVGQAIQITGVSRISA
ncbi:MAG: hypothetical protein ACOH2N_09050 [Devosia sp.]